MSVSSNNRTVSLFEEESPVPIKRRGVIRIGTSGYSFPDWQGPFYPVGLSRERWLSYYAKHFTTVEINATYYRTPKPSAFQAMAERTHDDFKFWVKVPGVVTHTDDDYDSTLEQFLEAVEPLKEAKKLTGYLAQFPPAFQLHERNIEKISRLQDALLPELLAVEFRADSWINEGTFSFLRERELVHVVVDLPELPGLPGIDVQKTGAVSYLRFHGRNKRTWRNSKLGDRYDYNYSESELKEWLPGLKELDEEGSTAYFFFNNCHGGQAVKNAMMLRQMLKFDFEDSA